MHPPYPRTAFIPAINGRVFCGIFINPQTGKEIKIRGKRVPKFVPGKALKNAVG